MQKIILTTIFIMTTLLNYAQNNVETGRTPSLQADGWVQPVSYTINGADQTDWIERMDVIKKEDGFVECRIRFKEGDNTEYWNFQTKNLLQHDQTVSGTLHTISMESNDWAYIDDKAHGTFMSDRNTGVEKLDIYFHIHQSDDIHNVISWKAFEYQPVGKTYRAKVQESCKRTTEGAFMDYKYCELTFEKDKVTIREYWQSLDPKDESPRIVTDVKYSWEMHNKNEIVIYGIFPYGTLEMRGNDLVGHEDDNGQRREVRFGEIRNNPMATEILNERWTEEENSENHITWYPDGTFSFTEANAARTYSAFGCGTYIYQINHGIREIFVQTGEMDVRKTVSDTTNYEIRDKRYFMILEMNDSMVKVHTIPFEYEIGWVLEPNGKYELIFPNDVIAEMPVMLKRYKRSKNK